MPAKDATDKPRFVVFVGLIDTTDTKVWVTAARYSNARALATSQPESTSKWFSQPSTDEQDLIHKGLDEQDLIHKGLAEVLKNLGMDYKNCTLVVASQVQRKPGSFSYQSLPPATIAVFIRDNLQEKLSPQVDPPK